MNTVLAELLEIIIIIVIRVMIISSALTKLMT